MAINNIEYVGLNTLERMSTNIAATYALKKVFGAASASANGSSGLVPAPTAGSQLKFLRADGTWALPTTYTLSSFGITATAAELNILDGATINVTELNYLKGVTSSIQTQLNGKAASSHGTHVTYGTTAPAAAGTASAGSASSVSRSDHVHPLQTSVSGNAGTATKLATARKFTIGSTGKDFDGTGALSWTLAEIGAAATSHSHAISDISDLQTALDGKAAASHGTHVSFTTTVPKAAGTASAGSASTVSRSDHVHPLQTSVSGNAGTATALQTPIEFTIGGHSEMIDGTDDIEFTLADIGAAAASHSHSIANITNLQTTLDGKAASSHAHAISDITNLQSTLDGKAASSHGTHVTYGTMAPAAAGTASSGSANSVSRSDHVHPLQTSVSGNAGTATKLAAAKAIKIGNTSKDFDGSADITWTLAEIGAAAASHSHSEYAASDHTHTQYLEAAGVAISVDDSAVIAAVTAAAS